ncbi:MAG: PD-(D/E)XK nuclease family protein [Flavobacteriales bacterium]
MKSFLDQVVEKIIFQNTEDIVFVLPNKRSGIFLKESWIRHSENKTTWLPQIWTIEEFMETVSELKQSDSITLFFEFYKAYFDTHENPESFEHFLKWISTTISDLNDIDRNLVKASTFFEYIISIERMDKWEPKELDYETDLIQNHFLFWKGVEKMYYQVHQNLKKQSLGYQGMIFREAYEKIANYITKNKTHFVFAGFNALTQSEEKIIQFLKKEKRASVFWDADEYYLNNTEQEAGVFLREKRKWRFYEQEPFSFVEKKLSQKKKIRIIGTPKQTGQVKLAGNILQELVQKEKTLTNTAFVLADENLLEPALNALPDTINSVNVTMGYPLKNVPLSTFFTSFLQLYANYVKFNQKGFYYEDVVRFFKNSYTDYLIENRVELLDDLVKLNKTFIPVTALDNASKIFEIEEKVTPPQIIEKSLYLIRFLAKNTPLKNHPLEMEYLFRFSTIWETINLLLEKFSFVKEVKVLQTLYNQILFNETLSFYGEPLIGLQLMGMLETRLLDFKNVIITSVNEGILPKGKTKSSFIPFDVRKHMELPTFQENDAIFAYHFYRLIQRAENIYLIYNTENDDYGAGEKSRFLTQLEIELPYEIKQDIAAEDPYEKSVELLQIIKSSKMMERLYEMAEKGFSPSALNNYIRNPLTFYYQNILGLQEVETIEETMNAKTLGIIVHNTLEKLYKPYIDEVLTVETISKLQNQSEKIVQNQLDEVYTNGDYSKGKNILIYGVAKRFVHNFLEYEKQEITEGNEIIIKQLEVELKIPFYTKDKEINLRGFADRIDQYNGIIRILDYKTGITESRKLKLNDFEEVTISKEYDKALQLLLYVYMYQEQFDKNEVSAGIISFRKLKQGVMLLNLNKNTVISKEDLEGFKPKLNALLLEILNAEIPIIEKREEE